MRPLPLLSLLLTMPALPALGKDAPPMPLRIGLDKSYRHATTLLLSCDKAFTLSDALSGHVMIHGGGGTIYKLTVSAKGMALARAGETQDVLVGDDAPALTVQPGAGDFVKVARLDGRPATAKGTPWHRYRGFLTVRREADNTLRVINTVPLEPYLYGVIPAEIGSKVPLEAMKAQAVAARTYALKNRGKCAKDGFDLDDTTHCEGYEGVDGETALSNAAVDATRGQVLTYDGRLIDAPYSTDSGGMTACDTNGDCPYLQAVRDADPSDGRDYAGGGKYHTWTQTFTAAQLAQILARDPRTRVSQFLSLTIDSLDASGRIVTATRGRGGWYAEDRKRTASEADTGIRRPAEHIGDADADTQRGVSVQRQGMGARAGDVAGRGRGNGRPALSQELRPDLEALLRRRPTGLRRQGQGVGGVSARALMASKMRCVLSRISRATTALSSAPISGMSNS